MSNSGALDPDYSRLPTEPERVREEVRPPREGQPPHPAPWTKQMPAASAEGVHLRNPVSWGSGAAIRDERPSLPIELVNVKS